MPHNRDHSGGATWTKVANQGNILLDYVAGGHLFGSVRATTFAESFMTSIDGGAHWQIILFPPMAEGQGFSYYIAALDGSAYRANGNTVYAWRNGAWTNFLFASGERDSITVTSISLDATGHPLKIWGHDDGAHPGVYWHSL